LEPHYLECPRYPVKCGCCGEEVERKNLKLHNEEKCAESPTKCPIEGCTDIILKRKNLKTHMEQKNGEHFLLMCNLVSRLQKKLKNTRKQY